MSTIANSWGWWKLVGTSGNTCINQHTPSKFTPITQICCIGRTQENTTEELQDGTRNSWNTISNWPTFRERRTGALMPYLGAQTMTQGKKTTSSWSFSHSDSLQMHMQDSQDPTKRTQTSPRSGHE